MRMRVLLSSMIKSVEELGGRFVRLDDNFIYFDIPRGSLLGDESRITGVICAFKETFNIDVIIHYS